MCRRFLEICLPDFNQIKRFDLFLKKKAAGLFKFHFRSGVSSLNDFQIQISKMRFKIEN